MILILTDADLSSMGRRLELGQVLVDHVKDLKAVHKASLVFLVRHGCWSILKDRTGPKSRTLGDSMPGLMAEIEEELESE